MLNVLAGPLIGLADNLIDNLFETDEEKANARLKIIKAEQDGALKATELQLSAIIAEAKSTDPWTSRARPSFLYIMYLVILLCLFGGILGIWWPDHMALAAENIGALLGAVPEFLWGAMTAGYLGYTGARSYDKQQITKGIKR